MSYENVDREKLEEVTKELEERVDELESENEDLKGERDEYEELARKHKADFKNYKKKQDERKDRWQKQAQQELAEDLISVIDNLERAVLAAEEDSSLVSGVKMVSDQLLETLEKRGLERIDAEGEEFDPELHNAVETREHEEERKVLEQKKPGYRHHGKILRPAEVVVSESKDSERSLEDSETENDNSNNDTTGET